MKATIIFTILFFQISSYAQDNSKPNHANKPSWSENMPLRKDIPEIEIEFDEDGSDKGFDIDRSSLFDTGDDSLESNKDIKEKNQLEIKQNEIERENLEKEKIIADRRRAEVKRIAEEKRKAEIIEKDRIKNENLLKQQREEVRIAEEKRLADQEKLISERKRSKLRQQQIEQDQIAKDQRKTDTVAIDESIIEDTNIADKHQPLVTRNRNYSWKKIVNSLPLYPTKAARANKEGWVDIEIIISSEGKVLSAKALKSLNNYRGFNKEAVKAVKKWEYDPPSNYGINHNQTKTVRIIFKL